MVHLVTVYRKNNQNADRSEYKKVPQNLRILFQDTSTTHFRPLFKHGFPGLKGFTSITPNSFLSEVLRLLFKLEILGIKRRRFTLVGWTRFWVSSCRWMGVLWRHGPVPSQDRFFGVRIVHSHGFGWSVKTAFPSHWAWQWPKTGSRLRKWFWTSKTRTSERGCPPRKPWISAGRNRFSGGRRFVRLDHQREPRGAERWGRKLRVRPEWLGQSGESDAPWKHGGKSTIFKKWKKPCNDSHG